jgi:hypothetical protein
MRLHWPHHLAVYFTITLLFDVKRRKSSGFVTFIIELDVAEDVAASGSSSSGD